MAEGALARAESSRFIAQLAALVPKWPVNLTCYHGAMPINAGAEQQPACADDIEWRWFVMDRIAAIR